MLGKRQQASRDLIIIASHETVFSYVTTPPQSIRVALSGNARLMPQGAVAYFGWKIKDRMEIDPRSMLSVMNNRSSR